MVVGVDASRNRSGGAKAHLIGILSEVNPEDYGITSIHVWSYRSLLDSLPKHHWLVKHNPAELEDSLIKQIKWQYLQLPKEAMAAGCDIMLYTDAGAIVNFFPCAVMSRDMLSFEPGEMRRFGFSKARLRLILLKYAQAHSLKKATAAIFLTNYASRVIQKFSGEIKNTKVIHHGVSNSFRLDIKLKERLISSGEIACIYISNASMYKHQWNVIKAVSVIRSRGYNIKLLLVGGGTGKAQDMVNEAKALCDPNSEYIKQTEFVHHNEINKMLSLSDIFIFASSCENMPNTLVEGMAAGLPIICSNRGPMPELLKDGGLYFDPENIEEISSALQTLIDNDSLRIALSKKAKEISLEYSWERCADETFSYLNYIANNCKSKTIH